MSLLGTSLLTVLAMAVQIYFHIAQPSDLLWGVLTIAVLICILAFLIAAVLNVDALFTHGSAKTLPSLGLAAQAIVLIPVVWFGWFMASTPNITGVPVIEYGVYHATVANQTDTSNDPVPHHNILKDISLAEKRDTLLASLGKTFGVRYVVSGSPEFKPIAIKIKYLYPSPGLLDPAQDTAVLSTAYSQIRLIGDTSYTCFTFDHDWEMVPGSWRIQILDGDALLAEKTFQIRTSH